MASGGSICRMNQTTHPCQAIANIDIEIAAIDAQLEAQRRIRAGRPRGDIERRLEGMRAAHVADREDAERDLAEQQAYEASAARIAERKQGRDSSTRAKAKAPLLAQPAARMDAAAAEFLAALDELTALSRGLRSDLHGAVRALGPLRTEGDSIARQSFATSVNRAAAGAHGATQFALVLFLHQLGQRLESPQQVFTIAPGWMWQPFAQLPFAEAAKQQIEDIEGNADTLLHCLSDKEAA